MKLQIETWSKENLPSNADALMEEAVICYKVGAYHAAYILSYLAFKTTIRERILKASRPDGISEKCWDDQIIKPLNDDDQWEGTLNTLVAQAKEGGSGKAGVFRFNSYEQMNVRYTYWRNVRNSCAHAKEEHITSATIEQFWNFMKDDLPEFYVSGGREYLAGQLIYAYKYFVSMGKEYLEQILKDIAIVYKKDTKKCFEELYNKDNWCLVLRNNNLDFWTEIINTGNEIVREAFLDFLYDHHENIIEWYSNFPKIFELMRNRHETFIQEQVVPALLMINGYSGKVFWSLLVKIIKIDPKLLPIKEITSDMYKYGLILDAEITDEEKNLLNKYHIFEEFLNNISNHYFMNDSSAHWNYYTILQNDAASERYLDYIIWDIDIVNRLEQAWGYLCNNMGLRENSTSIENGNKRYCSYRNVVTKYQRDIEDFIRLNGKTWSDYPIIARELSEI